MDSRSMKTRALEEIKELIFKKEIPLEELISEKAFAKRLNMSRSPIRDALAVLANEGLVELIPQVGIRIKAITKGEIQELLLLRSGIEQIVVATLAMNDNEVDFTILDDLLKDMERSVENNDINSLLDWDSEFHCALAEQAKLSLAAKYLRNMRDMIRIVGWNAVQTIENSKDVCKEHREILEALKQHDYRKTANEMKKHLKCTANRLGVSLSLPLLTIVDKTSSDI